VNVGQTVVVTPETSVQRKAREERRVLFDGVAGLYDATRQGYPAEIADTVATHAAAGPGAAVLEIGCGTGQFTRQLAGRAFNLTAIDIGAAMVQAARRNVADATVRFQVCSFEDFADGGPFDLIVSATAFHWVDPSVGLAKAARLLRPGGWLALLTTGERYPEPLRSRLRDLWIRYSRQSQEWAGQPAWLPALREADLFGRTVEVGHTRALRLPAETVIGVERTRATFLSYAELDQTGFTADLQALVESGTHIDLVQDTFLAMAPTVA
jgi:ubiquinone/menaquinone biosynthesis C-methylase UbiE